MAELRKVFDRNTISLRETRKETLEENTNYLEAIRDLKAEIVEFKVKQAGLASTVTEQASKIAEQDSKIAELRAIVEGNESRTTEAENKIRKIEEDLEKTKKEVED